MTTPTNTTPTTPQQPAATTAPQGTSTTHEFAVQYARFLTNMMETRPNDPDKLPDPAKIEASLADPQAAGQLGIADTMQAGKVTAWLTALNGVLAQLAPNVVGAFKSKLAEQMGAKNATDDLLRKFATTPPAEGMEKMTINSIVSLVDQANQSVTAAQQPPAKPDPAVIAAIAAAKKNAHEQNEVDRQVRMQAELEQFARNIDAVMAKIETTQPGLLNRITDDGITPPKPVSTTEIKQMLLTDRAENLSHSFLLGSIMQRQNHSTYMNETLEAIQSMSPEDMMHYLTNNDINLNNPTADQAFRVVEFLSNNATYVVKSLPLERAAVPFLKDIAALVTSGHGRQMLINRFGQPDAARLADALVGRQGFAERLSITTNTDEITMRAQDVKQLQQRHQYFSGLSHADKKLLLEEAGLGSAQGMMKAKNYFSPLSTFGDTLGKLMSNEMNLTELRQKHANIYAIFQQEEQQLNAQHNAPPQPGTPIQPLTGAEYLARTQPQANAPTPVQAPAPENFALQPAAAPNATAARLDGLSGGHAPAATATVHQPQPVIGDATAAVAERRQPHQSNLQQGGFGKN